MFVRFVSKVRTRGQEVCLLAYGTFCRTRINHMTLNRRRVMFTVLGRGHCWKNILKGTYLRDEKIVRAAHTRNTLPYFRTVIPRLSECFYQIFEKDDTSHISHLSTEQPKFQRLNHNIRFVT